MASGWKKNNPGCPCCDLCDIDEFSSAVTVEDANTRTVRSPSHPQSPYASWLQLEMLVKPSGIGVILLAWDDSTPGDGLYLEFTPDTPDANSGYISVYTKDDSKIAGPLYVRGGVSDEWHTFIVCYDPDKIPDQLVITFDPADTNVETQQFSVIVPDSFTAGTKAGYGTGNATGDVSVRNYDYDRLWYCGNGTEDCHEFADEWDYYNDLPQRTKCHECEPCPAGPRYNVPADWNILSGTWSGDAAIETYSSNAKTISSVMVSGYHIGTRSFYLYPGDEGVAGASDNIGHNQLYLRFSHNASNYVNLSVGILYDEEYGRFYFHFDAIVGLGAATLTYSLYRIEDSGTETLVDGPNAISSTLLGFQHLFLYDNYTSLSSEMRQVLVGTGTVGGGRKVIIGGTLHQCTCGGGYGAPEVPRKYAATVQGVAQGSYTSGGTYFDYTLMNRGPLSLRNYSPLVLGYGFESPCSICCHNNFALSGSEAQETWFYGKRVGNTLELHGYAYAEEFFGGGYTGVQVHFKKVLYGEVDLRDLDGEVLPFSDVYPSLYDFVNATNATFTISAVV